jgi:hypothetical protein
VKREILIIVLAGFFLTFAVDKAFGQCDLPGTPPCPPKKKKPRPKNPPAAPSRQNEKKIVSKPRAPTGLEVLSDLKKEEMPGFTDREVDQFGHLTNGDLTARMDNFFIQLMNDPRSVGIIIVSGEDRDVANRISSINKYILVRKRDPGRIQYRRGSPNREFLTKFLIHFPD